MQNGVAPCFFTADQYGTAVPWFEPTTGKPHGVDMSQALGLNLVHQSAGASAFHVTRTGTCTVAIFRVFLRHLLASSGTLVFLIVDGHAIHKAKLVRDFVAAQEGRLRLFYLPPYVP
jgi:hypothetical protein